MKRLLIVVVLAVFSLVGKAQSYVQIGPAVYPMGAWGGEVVGDFRIANFSPKLSLGLGGMAFINASKTHDEPTPGKQVNEYYIAPQISLRFAASSIFNCYLRGGAGLIGNKTDGSDAKQKFMYNGALGAGLSPWQHVGFYAEAGLPFSSLGLRFAF